MSGGIRGRDEASLNPMGKPGGGGGMPGIPGGGGGKPGIPGGGGGRKLIADDGDSEPSRGSSFLTKLGIFPPPTTV
jgi:hypothetical protein